MPGMPDRLVPFSILDGTCFGGNSRRSARSKSERIGFERRLGIRRTHGRRKRETESSAPAIVPVGSAISSI
jgi:hypothetical protein